MVVGMEFPSSTIISGQQFKQIRQVLEWKLKHTEVMYMYMYTISLNGLVKLPNTDKTSQTVTIFASEDNYVCQSQPLSLA